ncbi:MAG: hypothetical protein COT24_01015 [Candidatus Kerfeldbacteria bacterium CG08_land_8_20_14_0_20_40_16]|uniref:Translation initiation factor eIF-2B n=1 Tax=Candidatus Kerfeldbacteria bacterium CG08_land_8_20_14_0_20_40_16 TaxID=2014244 RepID=A0A2H0YYV8_9BACT|nr:MAG: hypothetical protein COT24_01015 [Candidatus Kerfeldbacteria bacterium CG08_land_8_20_14_0_20_40_16]
MDQTTKEAIKKIQSFEVQGATQITHIVLKTLREEGEIQSKKTKVQYLKALKSIGVALELARPTEPLARNAVRFVFHYLEHTAKGKSLAETHQILNKAINLFTKLLKYQEQKIAEAGSKLIRRNMHVFTHCHSSTVEEIILAAFQKKKNFKLFCTETRPLYQGRITARKLLKKKIDVTMVVDSAADFLISRTSGKELMMDLIFLGADVVTSGGSIINKIGSFGIAQVARYEKVPLYVATSLLKTDPETFTNRYVAIEMRDRKEVWPQGPKGLKIINFAFDRVPARFINGIVCEFGVIKPRQVASLVQQYYPWIFQPIK